jgi:hypothetical protein
VTLSGCSDCCGNCSKCRDRPRRLAIDIEFPQTSGVTRSAGEYGDSEDNPCVSTFGDISTNCKPDPIDISLDGFVVTEPGSGYKIIPEVTLSGDVGFRSIRRITGAEGSPLNFLSPPTVTISGGGGGGAQAVADIFQGVLLKGDICGGPISQIRLTNRGSGYTSPPIATVSGEFWDDVYLEMVPITIGPLNVTLSEELSLNRRASMHFSLAGAEIIDTGSGYHSSPSLKFSVIAGLGSVTTVSLPQAVAEVRGGLDSVTVTDNGAGYSTPPAVSLRSQEGSGAKLEAVLGKGYVSSVNVTAPGDGYTSKASVSFSGGGGSGASGVSVMDGYVSSVSLSDSGSGYTSNPGIILRGGGNRPLSAASARPFIGVGTAGNIEKILVGSNRGGSGYVATPSVVIAGGGGAGATAVAQADLTQGFVSKVTILSGGDGYTSAPSVSITGGSGSGATAIAFADLDKGFVSKINLLSGGAGYTSVPSVSITGGGGSGAEAVVSGIQSGSVTGISITYAGSGYTSAPSVSITGGGGVGATASSEINLSNNKVTSISVVSGGSGYKSWPAVSISGGGGSGAFAIADIDVSKNTVTGVTLISQGSGYVEAPRVIFRGGGLYPKSPAQVSAVADLTQGFVSKVTLSSGGSGYTSAPSVSITGGGGLGATAAVIGVQSGAVTGILLTSGGSGYTSAPSISFSGGGGSGAIATSEIDVSKNKIDSISITSGGSGYTSPPQVIFVPPGGGAVAAAEVTLQVSEVDVLSGGTKYTSAPKVSFSGGGGSGAQADANALFRVVSVDIKDAGSGYLPSPAVSFQGGGGSGAAATAKINGSIAGVHVTNSGRYLFSSQPPGFDPSSRLSVTLSGGGGTGGKVSGLWEGSVAEVFGILGDGAGSNFSAPPTVTIAPPPSPQGTVASISLTSGGSGYTSAASVSITGGGGSGAIAYAVTDLTKGFVSKVTLSSGGSGYTSAPSVSITGGGGLGATAEVTGIQSGAVVGISLTSGGSGYTSAPSISISGGGGSGAIATSEIDVSKNKITSISLTSGGSGYTSAPSVSISDGGGSGASATSEIYIPDNNKQATAEALLSWQEKQTRYLNFTPQTCRGLLSRTTPCYSNSISGPPILLRFNCGQPCVSTERTSWFVDAYIDSFSTHASPSRRPSGAVPGYWDIVFSGEGPVVYVRKNWGFDGFMSAVDERLYIKRAYSRVPPSGLFRASQDDSWDSAPNSEMPLFAPSFQQYEDSKGEPFWAVSSISLAYAGSNLRIEPIVAADRDYRINARHHSGNITPTAQSFVVDYTHSYSAPVVGTVSFGNTTFQIAPQFSFQFSPIPGNDGYYELSSMSIDAEGATTANDGVYAVFLSYLAGFVFPVGNSRGTSHPQVRMTISSGRVVSVAILSPGVILGPATLQSARLRPSAEAEGYPFYVAGFTVEDGITFFSSADPFFFTGTSTYRTEFLLSRPTVEPFAPTSGEPATFNIGLAERTAADGSLYWEVSEVEVLDGGTGYADSSRLGIFATGPNGVAPVPAVAIVSTDSPREPTLSVTGGQGGSGAELTVQYTQQGPVSWGVASVTVVSGGEGYVNDTGALFILGDGDKFDDFTAIATIYTHKEQPTLVATAPGGSGARLSVTLTPSGDNWAVASVEVQDGGFGYQNGSTVLFTGASVEDDAYAEITTGADDTITEVIVYYGGAYYRDTGVIRLITVEQPGSYYKQIGEVLSVQVISGGKYYDREIIETEELVPPVTCLGTVGPDSGWDVLTYKPVIAVPGTNGESLWNGPDVGQTFEEYLDLVNCFFDPDLGSIGNVLDGGFDEFYSTRTRVCPFPELTLRFE